MSRRWLAVIMASGLLLAACGGAAGPKPSPSPSPSQALPSPSPSPSASPSPSPSPSPSVTPTPSPTPTAEPACWPISGGSKANRALITDVRVGTHVGYDRLVIEMNAPITSYILEPHDITTFVGSFSGIPVKVLGSAGVILHAYNQDYPATFPHGTNIVTGFPEVQQVVVLGDFEGQADIAIGLAQLRCPKVYELSSPYRLVIDFPN